MPELRFDDRVAIVNGAGSNPGLGRSYALYLAARGAKVLVNDLGVGPDGRGVVRSSAQRTVEDIEASGGTALANTDSVTTKEGAEAIVAAALDAWGRVDILINNAGIVAMANFDEVSPTDVDRLVDVHVYGQLWMCRAVWPHMKQAGYGRIVNTTSGSMFGLQFVTIYGAMKAPPFSIARGLAREGAPHGIKANAISPGAGTVAAIELNEPNEWLEQTVAQASPDLVAPAVALLAHEQCPASGACIDAAAGHFGEIAFAQNAGYDNRDATPEDLLEHWAEITDHASMKPILDPVALDESTPVFFQPKPYVPDLG